MNLYVREYSWMWSDLHLSLAECRVYAYIYGLTNREKQGKVQGYNGSKRHLAELLGLNAGGVKKILDTLKERQLIVCTDNIWRSVESVNGSVDSVNGSVDSVNTSVDSVNESVESVNSPYNPLYNNKIMERNDKIARDTIATPNPLNLPSFEDLENLYKQRSANAAKISEDDRIRCRSIWDNYPDWKRKLLVEQLSKPDGWCKPRFDWTLADFNPQPTNYRGQELPKDKSVSSAKFNGEWGMYTEADIVNFGMERAPQPKVKVRKG